MKVDDLYLRRTMTKKAYKELQKKQRGVNGFNTGTRTMKDAHDRMVQKVNWNAVCRSSYDDYEL